MSPTRRIRSVVPPSVRTSSPGKVNARPSMPSVSLVGVEATTSISGTCEMLPGAGAVKRLCRAEFLRECANARGVAQGAMSHPRGLSVAAAIVPRD